jgi:carbohydrate kinase (thermoresistant glucokinase family)
MIVVLMGVCGCGKTTVGRMLAGELGWPFLDADDFHPPANVAKMAAGIPLTDEDRWPWLDRLASEMTAILDRGGHAVLACSALRQIYRDRLAPASIASRVRFAFLKGDEATIASRIGSRQHRYMPPSLLKSQFAALEEPGDAIVVDIRESVEAQVAAIRAALPAASAQPDERMNG